VKDNLEMRDKVIEDFVNIILPFWEEEVGRVMVGGYPKPFDVYLVD